MKELVFIDPAKLDATPFTTSEVIAEFAQVKHHAIQQMIAKYEAEFEEFGLLAFEMRAVEAKRGTKYSKVYHLNEQQATLLMTYLRNTEVVRSFKIELVRQFFQMRQELTRRQVEKAKLLPTRRELTDAIRDCIPESPHKAMWYKHYTDLSYKVALGMTAAELRKARNAEKDAVAVDFMTAEEMNAVKRVSGQISVLIEARMSYQEIKSVLTKRLSAAG